MPRRLSYGKLIDAILAMHAYGLDVLDVLADFRRAEASGSRLYGSVDLHLSPEGHDLLERLVGPAVVARLSRLTRRVSVMPAFSGTPRQGGREISGGSFSLEGLREMLDRVAAE